jgi:hypothetical protein
LSYNELASATIDQERMMKVVAEVDEKKEEEDDAWIHWQR